MLKRIAFVIAALTIFMVVSASAAIDCKKGTFVGSYTLADPAVDIFGDGSAVHSFVFQLNLHNDGTADQNWTGLLDFPNSTGSGSPWIGSWACRSDGKLVVTLLRAAFFPSTNPVAVTPDNELIFHAKSTLLFSITSNTTLTRVQSRTRSYNPSQDPTDPAGGTLFGLNTNEVVYTRFVASDSDLLAP